MQRQNERFGMMDEGYFVPKSEILSWINELLELNITKIQALGSGAIYCQLLDVVHPSKVSMSKINWKAKNDYEFLANFRLLQTGFEKAGIKRHIDVNHIRGSQVQVEKLTKAKYQDNLEFIQWFKRYFDLNCHLKPERYDAVERRGQTAVDFGFVEKKLVPKMYNAHGLVIPKSPTKTREEVGVNRVHSPRGAVSPRVANRPINAVKSGSKNHRKTSNTQRLQPKQEENKQKFACSQKAGKEKQIQYFEKENSELKQKLNCIEQIVQRQELSPIQRISMIKVSLGLPVQCLKQEESKVIGDQIGKQPQGVKQSQLQGQNHASTLQNNSLSQSLLSSHAQEQAPETIDRVREEQKAESNFQQASKPRLSDSQDDVI